MVKINIRNEFGKKPYALASGDKKKLEAVAEKMGCWIDERWHPLLDSVFQKPAGLFAKKISVKRLILHDMEPSGKTYENFAEEARNSDIIRQKLSEEVAKLKKHANGSHGAAEWSELDLIIDDEVRKIADAKIFALYGGLVFYDSEQEKHYLANLPWGNLYPHYSLLHLKTIRSGEKKVVLTDSELAKSLGLNLSSNQVNETEWKQYIEIMGANFEGK
jgi:hypothetical protein